MTTEAGKLYLSYDRDEELWQAPFYRRFGRHWTTEEVVAAIEAEALAIERARITEAVRGLAKGVNPSRSRLLDPDGVLAIVNPEEAGHA